MGRARRQILPLFANESEVITPHSNFMGIYSYCGDKEFDQV